MTDLQTLVNATPAGSTLLLAPGVYRGTLTLDKPITLQTASPLPHERPLVSDVTIFGVEQGVLVTGDDVTLRGITVRSENPARNLVQVTGSRFLLDRCVVRGGPKGARRGVMLNGDTALLQSSTIDDCWLTGSEAQAVAGWDGTKHILIDDCYLGGASQSVLFGGADSLTPDRIPTDITIRHSILTKNPAWVQTGAQVKTAFELKAAYGVHVHDCTLEYAGTSGGQGAYLIVLKSLNQDGKAPWSTVQDVLIERCVCRYGGGGVSFVGNDGPNPSGRMANITLADVTFTDIDPQGPTGGVGRGFIFQSGAIDVTLKRVTMAAKNMAASMYLIGPQPVRLTLRDVALPASTYGLKIDGNGSGQAAIKAWAPDCVLERVTEG